MSINPSKANSSTTKTFLTSLITNLGILAVEVGAFTVLKQRLGRIYTPRTYLPPPDKRSNELPPGVWRWIPATLNSPAEEIVHKNGLDAYLFLRFLKFLIAIFGVFWISTWIVLLPVEVAGVDTQNRTGLDKYQWGNVASQPERYAAHIVMVYLLTCFVLYMVRREMFQFVHMRHQFLISKSHSRLAQARTVLITNLPDELANDHDLRQFCSFVPGGVERIWIYCDSRDLNKKFEARQKACKTLESASSKLIRAATKEWARRQKAQHKLAKKVRKPKDVEKAERYAQEDGFDANALIAPPPSQEFLGDLVPENKRPKHRLGVLGKVGLGRKVDTIEWCKEEISRLNNEIEEGRRTLGERKSLGSAFVQCNLQIGAHVLAQCVSYHEPLLMGDKYIEVSPKDMIWSNLDDNAYETRARYIVSLAATVGLIIAWAAPVAFVGTISNIDGLCSRLPWVRWVCDAPTPVPGIISGVLPPVFLALLMIVLPFILRALAWFECIPRYSFLEVSVYKRYYAFLVIHGFLIVTLSSAITSTITDIITNPTTAVENLSRRLPDASIFFLTFIVTQGLTGAASALIQLGSLILHFIRKWFLGRTPRQAYGVTFLMPSANFGTVLPRISLLATIGLVYSVLSPIINGLATVAFFLLFIAWKFLLTQVFDQPTESETGGQYFYLALSNIFVGLYIEQIGLACLFFLNAPSAPKTSLAGGILMIVLLIVTVLFQILMHRSFYPISEYLPMSLATKQMTERYKKQLTTTQYILPEEEFDLFDRDRLRGILRRRTKFVRPVLGRRARPELKPDADDQERLKPGKSSDDKADATKRRSGSGDSLHSTAVTASSSSVSATPNPELPDIAPPQPMDEEEEEYLDEHAFDHPSTYVAQPWIWLPKDTLGLSGVLLREFKAAGVEASDVGSSMDTRGTVEVERNPPDEEWAGGHDR
ncbi:DUF221-domain-containing protein [Heliocybe sulcata]|uniref:DUF221-domain-containing protein n=1 Tax=Heliocybe sulcata TaxID=5364 RepID=A0A5C3MM46_9AGAM|nr:DUF221-domain-containing protein [Heliocybe sulcata]